MFSYCDTETFGYPCIQQPSLVVLEGLNPFSLLNPSHSGTRTGGQSYRRLIADHTGWTVCWCGPAPSHEHTCMKGGLHVQGDFPTGAGHVSHMDEEISETPLGGKGNQMVTSVSLRSWNPAPSASQFLRVSTWSTALVFLFFSQSDDSKKAGP